MLTHFSSRAHDMSPQKIIRHGAIVLLSVAYILVCTHTALAVQSVGNIHSTTIDLSEDFATYYGSAVFYAPHKNTLAIYNAHAAATQYPPQSTFKILSTVMGLEQGIIHDKKSTMHYTGRTYWLKAWNKNVTLEEAFQHSCVWYYHQIVYALPQKTVADFLHQMHYGNEDISQWHGNGSNAFKELNGFWLSSSLKISPIEQVRMLAHLFEGNTSLQPTTLAILKDIMQQKEEKNVYGKTGADMKGKSWFVGFVLDREPIYFAFHVNDVKAGPRAARDIARNVLPNVQRFLR